MSILAVGSIAFDSITTSAGQADRVLGGSVSHFAVAASNFAPVSVVAIVGEDFTDEHMNVLRAKGVNTEGVEKAAGKTFSWGGKYSADFHFRETLFTHLNVLEQFKPTLLPAHKSLPHIFLGNIDPETQLDVLNQVESPQIVFCDTMNYWIEQKREQLLETLKHIDVLIINDSEALQLAGTVSPDAAVQRILDIIDSKHNRTAPALIIKQAEQGATLYRRDGTFHIPAYPIAQVIDPTGAGDSFAGGFVGHLARTSDYSLENMKKALGYGCATASFNLQNFGLEDLKKATAEQIEERYKTFNM